MRAADPEFWGETESQNITESIDRGAKWFGVKVSDEIVSVGSGRTKEWGGLIGVVATSKPHRCKGYAISVVSTLVKKLLEKNPLVMIFVRSASAPAVNVYEKVGFKQYRKYFFMRGERRKYQF
ncbi:MAG: GNAT family N-acetyltransferase [Candidatus Bathyarchaeia archaeon]